MEGKALAGFRPAPGKVDVVLGRDGTPPDRLNGRGLRQAALSSRLERASNVFSWQAFIGPQWPATKTERGQPDPNAPIGALEMRSCPIAAVKLWLNPDKTDRNKD